MSGIDLGLSVMSGYMAGTAEKISVGEQEMRHVRSEVGLEQETLDFLKSVRVRSMRTLLMLEEEDFRWMVNDDEVPFSFSRCA